MAPKKSCLEKPYLSNENRESRQIGYKTCLNGYCNKNSMLLTLTKNDFKPPLATTVLSACLDFEPQGINKVIKRKVINRRHPTKLMFVGEVEVQILSTTVMAHFLFSALQSCIKQHSTKCTTKSSMTRTEQSANKGEWQAL